MICLLGVAASNRAEAAAALIQTFPQSSIVETSALNQYGVRYYTVKITTPKSIPPGSLITISEFYYEFTDGILPSDSSGNSYQYYGRAGNGQLGPCFNFYGTVVINTVPVNGTVMFTTNVEPKGISASAWSGQWSSTYNLDEIGTSFVDEAGSSPYYSPPVDGPTSNSLVIAVIYAQPLGAYDNPFTVKSPFALLSAPMNLAGTDASGERGAIAYYVTNANSRPPFSCGFSVVDPGDNYAIGTFTFPTTS